MVYNIIHKYVNANGRIVMAGWRWTTLSKQRHISPLECVMSAGFGSLFSPAYFFSVFVCVIGSMFTVHLNRSIGNQ